MGVRKRIPATRNHHFIQPYHYKRADTPLASWLLLGPGGRTLFVPSKVQGALSVGAGGDEHGLVPSSSPVASPPPPLLPPAASLPSSPLHDVPPQSSAPVEETDDPQDHIHTFESQTGVGHAVQTHNQQDEPIASTFAPVPVVAPTTPPQPGLPHPTIIAPPQVAGGTVFHSITILNPPLVPPANGAASVPIYNNPQPTDGSPAVQSISPSETAMITDIFITTIDPSGHTTRLVNPRATNADASENTGPGSTVPIIIGVSVAGLIALAGFTAFVSWLIRSRRKRKMDLELDGMMAFGDIGDTLTRTTTRTGLGTDDGMEGLKRRVTAASIPASLHANKVPTNQDIPPRPHPAYLKGTEQALGPLQVTNLMPGDMSVQGSTTSPQNVIHQPSPLMRGFGTPREPVSGLVPRFLPIERRALDVPWTAPSVLQPTKSSILLRQRAGGEGWRSCEQVPSRLPTPRTQTPAPSVGQVEGWASTLRSNIFTALSAVTGLATNASSEQHPPTDDRFTPLPRRHNGTSRPSSVRKGLGLGDQYDERGWILEEGSHGVGRVHVLGASRQNTLSPAPSFGDSSDESVLERSNSTSPTPRGSSLMPSRRLTRLSRASSVYSFNSVLCTDSVDNGITLAPTKPLHIQPKRQGFYTQNMLRSNSSKSDVTLSEKSFGQSRQKSLGLGINYH